MVQLKASMAVAGIGWICGGDEDAVHYACSLAQRSVSERESGLRVGRCVVRRMARSLVMILSCVVR
jgi:hypothetical protein